ISTFMTEDLRCKDDFLDDPKNDFPSSVEVVNNEVLKGDPFRDAYRNIGLAIEAGTFKPHKEVNHTHEGSIGNLCNAEIRQAFHAAVASYGFDRVNKVLQNLLA